MIDRNKVKDAIIKVVPINMSSQVLDAIYSIPDEPCERCKELEAKLTDYFHTSSHKVKDKRIEELEARLKINDAHCCALEEKNLELCDKRGKV
jgi:hypothetical protein